MTYFSQLLVDQEMSSFPCVSKTELQIAVQSQQVFRGSFMRPCIIESRSCVLAQELLKVTVESCCNVTGTFAVRGGKKKTKFGPGLTFSGHILLRVLF